MLEKIKRKMDRSAEKMAKYQTILFLNLFYILAVPVAAIYLTITRRLHHNQGGYFTKIKKSNKTLESLKNQY